MILSRRVSLGGVQLDELDESIVIRGIDTGVPHESLDAVSRMGGAGQRLVSQHWETLDVSVRWAMDIPKRQLARRREVFEAVTSWAMQNGWLTVNYMTGRRMYVDKTILPGSGDMWNWTDEFTITFRAYNVPFWQDEQPISIVRNGITTVSASINIPGQARTVLDVSFKNTSGASMDTLSVSAGGNTISLSGLGLASGSTVAISHGTDGLLRIMKGSTSVYDKYTGSDDLYVNPGACTVSITAGKTGNATISATGRYF